MTSRINTLSVQNTLKKMGPLLGLVICSSHDLT